MAKLEISFPYKTLSKQAAVAYCIAWGVFGAWLVTNLVLVLHTCTGFLDPVSTVIFQILFVIGSAAIYSYVPFRLVTTCLQGGTIAANQEGLGVPGTIFGNAKFRSWTQLKLAETHRDKILLTFGANDLVSIDTKQLDTAKLEQLLLALEVWGHKAVLANSLLELRDHIQNQKAGIEDHDHDYTKIWEEELNRRFNSTTFVPLEPGHKLRSNSFSIIKQLAFGGFSAVYLAEDHNRNQVVIKELVTSMGDSVGGKPGDKLGDNVGHKLGDNVGHKLDDNTGDKPADSTNAHDKALEFFKREALFLSGLNHPQIAKVLDNFIENGRNYLALQYIAGENLREYVRKHGSLDEKLVLRLMTQMADVLSYLHEQDPPIMHRDFTPDNLVLRADQTIVVIDFGAANEYVGTATGTLIGKQCYMPPEQVRGKSEPTTDLYALGCTAGFLLTAHDPEALMVCHPRAENPKVSESIDKLIADLTQQDSKKRVQSARALKSMLHDLIETSNCNSNSNSNSSDRRTKEPTGTA